MKALVIEDDVLLKDFIAMCLIKHGFEVDTAVDGEKGFKKAGRIVYDIIVLGVNLPVMSGTEICTQLRILNNNTPILFVSAVSGLEDRVRALELGADDYLVKPFSHSELVARAKALVRRASAISTPKICYGSIEISVENHLVELQGSPIRLTPNEFKVLELLVRNPEKVLTREYLLISIWDVTPGNTSNRLEVCVKNIRRKLLKAQASESVATEYGVGYKLTMSTPIERT